MIQNKFDMVMDYIDANITEDTEAIKKGIYNLIGYNSNTFGNCFLILTGETLFHYINSRRMFFAGEELRINLNKPICDIALEYGYSEQSAFTRAMKTYHNCTPNEVRKGIAYIENKKYLLSDINSKESDTRTQRILKAFERNEPISSYNMELLISMENASDEYGFDIDMCYQIADIAEKLEVPPLRLIDKCFQAILESENDISQEERVAIECGIESDEELKAICEFFDCKYYDLDSFMVNAYRNRENI